MLHKLRRINKKKLIGFFIACWVFTACYSLSKTPTSEIITKTGEPSPSMLLTPTPNSLNTQMTPLITPAPNLTPVIQTFPAIASHTNNTNQYGSIFIVDKAESNIFIFSPSGQFQKKIQLINDIYPKSVEQMTDNCNFILFAASMDSHKLIKINLLDGIEQELISLKNARADTLVYMPTLSQSGQYVAYVVFSGELYYDSAQNQDIEIVSLDNANQPIRITSHGGAWKKGGAWSPSSAKIAYTDYDDDGILQVYIAQVENEITKEKITQFNDLGVKAGPISWSPSGNQLAVVLKDKEDKDSIWIVNTQDNSAFKLDLPRENLPVAENLFWSEDDSVLLFALGNSSSSSDVAGLYWFDIKNNKLSLVLTLKSAFQMNPEVNSFAFTFPITTDLSEIVFYNSVGKWYLYDVTNHEMELVPWLSDREWGSHLEISLFTNDATDCSP